MRPWPVGWRTSSRGRRPNTSGRAAGLAQRHATAVEHYLAGRQETALPLLGQIVFGCRAVLGERHPDTLTVEGNLAVVCLRAGHDDEGSPRLEEACEAREPRIRADDCAR